MFKINSYKYVLIFPAGICKFNWSEMKINIYFQESFRTSVLLIMLKTENKICTRNLLHAHNEMRLKVKKNNIIINLILPNIDISSKQLHNSVYCLKSVTMQHDNVYYSKFMTFCICVDYSIVIPYLSSRYWFFTCTWLDINGKRDTHGKRVRHWHVPHIHIRYIQTLLVHCNVHIKTTIGYGL